MVSIKQIINHQKTSLISFLFQRSGLILILNCTNRVDLLGVNYMSFWNSININTQILDKAYLQIVYLQLSKNKHKLNETSMLKCLSLKGVTNSEQHVTIKKQ